MVQASLGYKLTFDPGCSGYNLTIATVVQVALAISLQQLPCSGCSGYKLTIATKVLDSSSHKLTIATMLRLLWL